MPRWTRPRTRSRASPCRGTCRALRSCTRDGSAPLTASARRRFPTLKLYPADSDDVIDYSEGERTLDDLKKFLGKNVKGVTLSFAAAGEDGTDGHEEL